MDNILITSKSTRFDVPIPENSEIAVTDVFFENKNYNILDGRFEIKLYPDMHMVTDRNQLSKISLDMKLRLIPGKYPNFKSFLTQCLSVVENLKTFSDRNLIYNLFLRFREEGGRLRISPCSENDVTKVFYFKVKFLDKSISKYLGLHENVLFINRRGMASSYLPSSSSLPSQYSMLLRYFGPQLNLMNFESRINFNITCEEVDTAFNINNKEILNIFLKSNWNNKKYIQPKNVNFHRLTNNTHSMLRFNWPEGMKLIFFNLTISSSKN